MRGFPWQTAGAVVCAKRTERKLFGLNLAPIIEQASELLAEAEVIHQHEEVMDLSRSEIRLINKNIRQMHQADWR